ncbi:MAG: hypothetical protein VX410_03780, partial [Actinomycetota bacterium]|nr:hypothetical protein [Actinomycetota bacterium]
MSFFRRLLSRKAIRKRKQRNRQHRRREFVNEIARQLNHEPLEERRLLTVDFAAGATANINESGGLATFSVTLSGDALTTGQTASVDISQTGSATSGVDYDAFNTALTNAAAAAAGVNLVGSTLTFDDGFNGTGTGTFQFSVSALNDSLVEETESITATLSSPTTNHPNGTTIATAAATTTITDNESATINYVGTANTGEGGPTGSINATLSLSGDGTPELAVPVDATVTSATNDFTATTVGWIAGDTGSTKNITVTATDDVFVEQTVENNAATLVTTTDAT